MLSFDRRMVLGAGLAALAGCGFTPVYNSQTDLRGKIQFDMPKSQPEFVLRNALEDRIGTPDTPIYRLKVSTQVSEDGIAITSDQVTTRFNVIGSANYTLFEIGTETVVTEGKVDNFTSYSATGTTVATPTAERDANDRLMIILADQITARLMLALG